MLIRVLGNKETAAYDAAVDLISELGHKLAPTDSLNVDLAIAPLLTCKVPLEELQAPIHGTLIFHPSPLPYGRGASSIRWAYRRKESITAATWFWANDKMDGGPVCEMEIVKIDYNLSPRGFYETHILPAMVRSLKRSLLCIASGYKRQVPQVEEYATFDKQIKKGA